MTVLNLREAAQDFAKDPAVIDAVKSNGELTITAGKMAEQSLPEQAQYKKLATAIGAETPLFRFVESKKDSEIPLAQGPSVFADLDGNPIILTPGLNEVEAEFQSYKLGVGGYALAKVGSIVVEVEIRVADEMIKEIRLQKASADEGEEPTFKFEMQKGIPTAKTMIGDVETQAIRMVPQREIPPHSDDIPLKTEFKVTELLKEPTRQYGEPRLAVVNVSTGEVINGLIATAPIREIIGVKDGESYKLTPDSVGACFEVIEHRVINDKEGNPVPVLDRNGEKAKDSEGNPRYQKTVIVRRTDRKGLSL